jgi:hypothetical protein
MQAKSFLLGSVGIAIIGLTALAEAQRMPPNSYLRQPAESRFQLVQQVRTDPVVSARFQRHFAMSHDEVVEYFSTLRTSRLEEGGRYLVWHVREGDGQHMTRWLTVSRGEPVFIDESGRPILKVVCGNPLVDRTVARRAAPTEIVAAPPTQVAVTPPVVEEQQAFVPASPTLVALTPPPLVEVADVRGVMPPELAVVTPVITPVAPAVVPMIAAAPAFPLWAGLLPAAALLFPRDGDGGPGDLGSIPLGGAPVGTAVVPEPASMLLLGAGAAAVAFRRRRKQQ